MDLGGALIGAAGGSAAEQDFRPDFPRTTFFFKRGSDGRGVRLVIAMADSEDNGDERAFHHGAQ